MDEVGRGTTPVDGLAIAYACLHHLYTINCSRALFATHFHQLADMAAEFENVGCYCTDLEEGVDGTFSYIHKLRRGVNKKSHALKVARLAGKNKLQPVFSKMFYPFARGHWLMIAQGFRRAPSVLQRKRC